MTNKQTSIEKKEPQQQKILQKKIHLQAKDLKDLAHARQQKQNKKQKRRVILFLFLEVLQTSNLLINYPGNLERFSRPKENL